MKHTEPGHSGKDPSDNSGNKDSSVTPETTRQQGEEYTRAAGSAAVNEAMVTPGKAEPAQESRIIDPGDVRSGIGERIDMAELADLARRGKVVVTHHPTEPILVCNYTSRRPIGEKEWTPLLALSRGLIVHENGEIIARPFSRMRELGETQELPPGQFEITKKLDGSLGIQYEVGGIPHIATRGRFDSEQSARATEMLGRYTDQYQFRDDVTHLWEIIYPENRVVVDYGDQRDITLLGMVETATGRELPLPNPSDVPFPVVERYEGNFTAAQLRGTRDDNFEGYIARNTETDERFKVKLESYYWRDSQRKGTVPQRAWRQLSRGKTPDQILEAVPEVAREEVAQALSGIQAKRNEIEERVRESFKDKSIKLDDKEHRIKSSMRSKQPYDSVIWKMVRPDPPQAERAQDESRDRNPPGQQGPAKAPHHDEFGRTATAVEPMGQSHVAEQEPVLELETPARSTPEPDSQSKTPQLELVAQQPPVVEAPKPLAASPLEIELDRAAAVAEAEQKRLAAETLARQQQQALEQQQRGIEPER